MDAEGFINFTAYDLGSGAVVKSITDVNTSGSGFSGLPGGWTTPGGGGAHLTTEMEVDLLGRTTKLTEPGPRFRVTYTVFNDVDREIRTYAGWDTTTNRPTGPTRVVREDREDGYTDVLTMSVAPNLDGGRPDGTEAISDLESLSRSQRNLAGQTIFTDQYFDLDGLTYADTLGDENDDFGRTEYDYDQRGRMHRIETPDILDAAGTGTQSGTITRRVFDGLGRLVSVWQGDDDTGATSSDPSNGGSNDMVLISFNEYDKGGIGDSNLTKTTVPLGPDEDDRVTVNWFDWRNRLVATKDGVEGSEDTGVDRPLIYYEHDNLGQTTLISQYDGDTIMLSDGNNDGVPDRPDDMKLRARMKSMFDEEGQMFRSISYTVDPSTGATSEPLTNNTWFNQRGLTIKMRDPSGTVMKNEYDGVGRTLATYVTDGGGDADWSDADDVDSDIVLSQTEYEYDTDSNVILVTVRERLPGDVITTGVLGDASGMGGVAARVSYIASYYDLDNRLIATVNVGTFGGAVFTRPDEEPLTWADSGDPYLETLADETLITSYTYNILNGYMESVTDPRGIVTAYVQDDLGRTIATIDAFDGDLDNVELITLANITTYAPPGLTENRIVTFDYDPAGHMVLRSHLLPGGAVQQTRYIYGVIFADGSDIESPDLLRAIQHPDKMTGAPSASEQEFFTYNEIGQLDTKTDRNGTVHFYEYDVLGRLISDSVTTLGSGVDGAIRRIETDYDEQGNAFLFTSYSDPAGGAMNIVNQVERVFDGLGNLVREYQDHDGEVDGSTPFVDYIYTYTGNSQSRLEAIVYPDGRIIHYVYASGLDDTISRLSAIADDDGFGSPGQVLEAYTYMGVSTVVERLHPESGVDLTYLSGNVAGDGGDTVVGLDRFGRIVDHFWANFNTPTITDEFVYGYDRNSNRLYRDNVLDPTFGELYAYDNFDQLSDFARGTLSTTSDSIVGTPVRSQDWSPHPLGNASTISTSISGTPTPEGRTYNAQNQFDTVGGNSLSYDNNGNLIVDQNGNLYFYDAWNRFVKVEDSSNNLLTAYNYNPLNHRIIEDDGTTETHLFYSANWQVLEEQVSGDTITQYVWSPVYIDAMILRDRDANSSSGDGLEERLYVQQDANWNVTALVDASTGDVVQRFVQDPFGLVTDILDDSWSPQADAYDWKYLHQGLRLDMAVGMNLYDGRNRIYDPVLQRWLQVDPSGFNAGDSNLYRYVGNKPTNGLDPFGLEFKTSPIERVRHIRGTAYGETIVSFNLEVVCVAANGKWKMRLDEFTVSAFPRVRTHYYDRWDVSGDEHFGEFKRQEKNIERTIKHEEQHVKYHKEWHDTNEGAIRADFTPNTMYDNEKICKDEVTKKRATWMAKWAAFSKDEHQHTGPRWEGWASPGLESSLDDKKE